MIFHDQLNRTIELSQTPRRIVSLVPSQTELIVDLGLEDQLVGITKFCVHPPHLRKEKQIIGGTKKVKMQLLRDLKPDIILCNKEENTKDMVEGMAGEFPVHISDIYNLEDTYEMIRQYGEIFNTSQKATEINTEIKKEYQSFIESTPSRPRYKVAYFIWRKPWMVVGNHTFVNYLLAICGFENVYADLKRYPEVTIENLRPTDFTLLSSEPYPFKEKDGQFLQPYLNGSKVVYVDGELFSWYGSRLAKAFSYFKQLRNEMEMLAHKNHSER